MKYTSILRWLIPLALLTSSCGGTGIGNPLVTIQTHPLAGPDAAMLPKVPWYMGRVENLLASLFGIQKAWAAVSTFNRFEICLSEITFELLAGGVDSGDRTLSPGLLSFSPSSTEAMTIGGLNLTPGSTLKNVKFVIATKPEICSGANYAVLFNSPSSGGDRLITQDVSFRFDFPSSGYVITGSPQTIDLLLGQIVNGMVALGATLDNSTIQTVNVGQAQ